MIAEKLGSLLWRGIQVIPSDEVPIGYKRTEGDTIFVNPTNYAFMKPLSAVGTLVALGFLQEWKGVSTTAETNPS